METTMDTRKLPGSRMAGLVTLIGSGLLFIGCTPDPGTGSPSGGSSSSGGASSGGQTGGSGGRATGQGGAAGAGHGGAGGAGQGGAAGAGQGGAAGAGHGGAGGAGQGGAAGAGQGGAAGAGQGGAAGAGQGGAAGAGQAGAGGSSPSPSSGFRSPYAVAYSDDSATLAVSDASAAALVILDPKAGTSLRSVGLDGEPKGLAWSGAGKVMVAEYGAGTIAEVDTTAGSVLRRLNVGPKPTDVALTADCSKLVVPDFALNQVLILDSATGNTQATLAVAPRPFAVAIAPTGTTGSTAVVTHLLASGDATQPDAAASVTLVDIAGGKVIANVKLPVGSTAVRGVSCSPDGKWAYVVHQLGRLNNPVTHLLRGWVWTNALSIIDIANKSVYATTLLDRISEGAANPWGVNVSPDGKTLWVSAAGAHQVLRVDLSTLQQLLAGPIPSALKGSGKTPTATARSKAGFTKPLSDVWFDIAADPTKRSVLANDLGALWGAGLLQVIRLAPAQGPRGVAVSPDGKQLAVASLLRWPGRPCGYHLRPGHQVHQCWHSTGRNLGPPRRATVPRCFAHSAGLVVLLQLPPGRPHRRARLEYVEWYSGRPEEHAHHALLPEHASRDVHGSTCYRRRGHHRGVQEH